MSKLQYWQELFHDARSKRATLDDKLKRHNELYRGTNRVKNRKRNVKGDYSNKLAYTYRNLVFELIETQINNSVPAPKVTPRDKRNIDRAIGLEDYLKSEMDRIQSEAINDESERSVYKHGSTFYQIGWDESVATPTTRGELFLKHYPLDRIYMQPGASGPDTADYIFTIDRVSTRKIKEMYNVIVPDSSEFRGLNTIITAWYYNDKGYVSRFAWVDNSEQIVFDQEDFELRRVLKCDFCDNVIYSEEECPKCGHTKFSYKPLESEILDEPIIKVEPDNPAPIVLADKGDEIPFYKIRELPFVLRVNISDEETPYGISDIDILEENQEALNKVLTKMEENILKSGVIVTTPKGVNIANSDDSIKIVQIKDPRMMQHFNVFSINANTQQDDILANRMYEYGRQALGITDSYQGKRDPTAESGKAKEISAAQAAGRLESKRRMKDAAYAEIYRIMFKFLLAYCDEKRVFTKVDPLGEAEEESFSRYSFLDGVPGNIYYNDRYNFSVDTASILSTSREAMWKEATNNLMAGAFGHPEDPHTLVLYWNVMKDLSYPLAKQTLSNLQARMQQLPQEIQQAIMNNPEILNAVQQVMQGKGGEPVDEDSKQQD